MDKQHSSLRSIGGRGMACLMLLCFFALVAQAQQRTLPEEDWYGDIKRALTVHYVGKGVRVTLPIPKSGVEILDGVVQRPADAQTPEYLAQPGDELMIKSLKITDNEIEFTLGKDEPPPKRRFPNPFSPQRQPRVSMLFSRELNTRDLTIENINKYLALVVEVDRLAGPSKEPVAAAQPVEADESEEQSGLTIVGTLTDQSVGELSIECTAGQARIYIDGSYSGTSPRTLRLSAGEHTIMIVHDGYPAWERRIAIPAGKAAALRAEMVKR